MKYLITGVTGFIGPHIAKILIDQGHDVYGMYRSKENIDIEDTIDIDKITLVYGDFMDENSIYHIINNHKFDGVFHVGAFTHPPTSFEKPSLCFKTNALGSITLFDAIQRSNPKCVIMNCSTSEVYGVTEEGTVINEDFPEKPMNPYGVSKAAADLYFKERTRNDELKGFTTRAFSHTGPRRRHNYSISSDAIQIAKIIKGLQEPIIKVGNLDCKRVVMDVRDVADVYCKLMDKFHKGEIENGKIFHIAGDGLHKIEYFLDMMLSMFNVEAKFEVDPNLYRPIDIPIQMPDSSLVRETLDWRPSIPIGRTLKDLVYYWLEKL